MSFRLNYSSRFRKWIKKLDKATIVVILKKLQQLQNNPELGKPLRNILKNKRSIRIGKFRILYSTKGKEILITNGRHRKKVYK